MVHCPPRSGTLKPLLNTPAIRLQARHQTAEEPSHGRRSPTRRRRSPRHAQFLHALVHVHEPQGHRHPLPVVSAVVGFISVAFTVYMRLELMDPGVQHMCLEGARFFASDELYAQRPPVERADHRSRHPDDVLCGHSGAVRRISATISCRLQIGAPDMAFPRLNNLSFWMYVAGTSLASLRCCPGRQRAAGSGVGWVLYPPLSTSEAGCRWISRSLRSTSRARRRSWAAINMITTFLNMRAPGMTLFKVPLFAWSIFVTAWLILLSLPVLAGAITMLLTDRNFRHHVLPARRRRRSDPVSAHPVVLWPPGSVHRSSCPASASSAT